MNFGKEMRKTKHGKERVNKLWKGHEKDWTWKTTWKQTLKRTWERLNMEKNVEMNFEKDIQKTKHGKERRNKLLKGHEKGLKHRENVERNWKYMGMDYNFHYN